LQPSKFAYFCMEHHLQQEMNVLGIMSGTSMDGIDLALCNVQQNEGKWTVEIIQAITVPYNETWRVRLSQLRYQTPELYAKTDVFYGRYLGELARGFQKESGLNIDLVASHGHTIFHDPHGWLTAQVGDGATLAATSGIPAVTNFRRADVAAGGQGAPLVTVGDELLFSQYDACLNLGGFCNLSVGHGSDRMSFDIAPCNIVLNRLARERGLKFDEDGLIAESGNVIYPLLEKLNQIKFYQRKGPKSLGREWINKEFWHIVRDFDDQPVEDRMKTLVMHCAVQIARALEMHSDKDVSELSVLVTGGGAFNKTLIDYIQSETSSNIVIPDKQLVNYKEAMIFALLGAMRVKNIANVNNKATGASVAVIGGSLDGDFSSFI
jgi:anhydro-N-acetylmuramic acid kinase